MKASKKHIWSGSTKFQWLNHFLLFFILQLRHLNSERADLAKRLKHREEETSKLEGRLQQALKDKSSLQAGNAALEKELLDTRKSNEHLKHKVS